MAEYLKYHAMKEQGGTPEEVHAQAEQDGVDKIHMFQLLRQVFNLSFIEVKDVLARANGYQSLDEFHEKLATQIGGS